MKACFITMVPQHAPCSTHGPTPPSRTQRSRYAQVDARESMLAKDETPQRLTQAHVSEDKGGKTNVFASSLRQALLRLLSPGVAPPQKMDTDATLAGRGASSRKGNAGETWQLLVSDSRPYVVRDILPISCGQQVDVHTHIVDRDLSLSYIVNLVLLPARSPARTHA